ncbi:MAG: putative toxin-antitoxin system toxin component, PIN family [candidate division NC10 bacterium]|nr:putative toxin-antitoxin system toxin component, PIN family [candidate division NC10 bacterium]
MKVAVLVDTNVWVSALLNPSGPPAQLKNAWVDGLFDVIVCLPVLEEIADVLQRPRIQRKYKIHKHEIVQYLRLITGRAILVPVTGTVTGCRDPDDNLLLEAAITGGAKYLVTRDDDLKRDLDLILQMRQHGVRVVSVSQFLKTLRPRSRRRLPSHQGGS